MDQYFTVQPHTLLRQHLDYSHWYDRTKLTLKDIHNTQYVSCMNPTAGSFTINTRLQRHFSVFALSFPGADALATIYNSILSQHMAGNHFAVRCLHHCYLRRLLASGEGIVTLGVTLSRCVCVLGGEGNALYPVLSSTVSDDILSASQTRLFRKSYSDAVVYLNCLALSFLNAKLCNLAT